MINSEKQIPRYFNAAITLSFFIIGVAYTLYAHTEAPKGLKTLMLLSHIVISLGVSLILCAVASPIIQKIKQMKERNPATGLYIIIGLFFTVWGILLYFMNKVG